MVRHWQVKDDNDQHLLLQKNYQMHSVSDPRQMSWWAKFLLSLIETWKTEGCAAGEYFKSNTIEFYIWFLWWIREPRFCRTCSSAIWGALKSRLLSFNETWKAGVCHRLLLKIQHDWIFYFDYCDESVSPDFAGLLALSHDEVPSRLLLVSALTIKSEFFLNLPYKDWIVCKDVFQVNAQIVPEIV